MVQLRYLSNDFCLNIEWKRMLVISFYDSTRIILMSKNILFICKLDFFFPKNVGLSWKKVTKTRSLKISMQQSLHSLYVIKIKYIYSILICNSHSIHSRFFSYSCLKILPPCLKSLPHVVLFCQWSAANFTFWEATCFL